MNLLLVNDDGYRADGINILARVLSEFHHVYIFAPDGNRSASSHCISMHEGLKIKKIKENVWACSGKPADCTFTGLKTGIIPEKIDLVISGINHGGNLGTDIVYSGTCGAAREGVLLGFPSVAVSLEFDGDGNLDGFERLAFFVRDNLEKFIKLYEASGRKGFVNINAMSSENFKGAEFTSILAERIYDDGVQLSESENGIETTNRAGELIEKTEEGSDEDLVKKGFISISVVAARPEGLNPVEGIVFSL